MPKRRRKITRHYRELLEIPLADLVAIGKAYTEGAQITPDAGGYAYIGPRDADGRGAAPKASVCPAFTLNLAIVARCAEIVADGFERTEGGDRQRHRAEYLRQVGVWRDSSPPSKQTIMRWRDLWPNLDHVDTTILAAHGELRTKHRIMPRMVLTPGS